MCYLTNKEAQAVYYTVMKHDGNLRTWWKCTKHEPRTSVFCISRVFSNVRSVLSQCSTRLIGFFICFFRYIDNVAKTIKHAFSMFHILIKRGFLSNQSARRVLSTITKVYVLWSLITPTIQSYTVIFTSSSNFDDIERNLTVTSTIFQLGSAKMN